MTSAIFIDANVPIYAAGRPHPLKEPCALVLHLAAERPDAFVTSAEVLQELLHRYISLRTWEQGRQSLHSFARLMQERVEPVYPDDIERAAILADEINVSARDLVHAAVMARLGIQRIVTADRGFDRIPGIERLDPAQVETWMMAALDS